MSAKFQSALTEFVTLYKQQWADAHADRTPDGLRVSSATALRPDQGNHPKILHHGRTTANVIVLIHGITDSPYYVEAIGKRLHALGFNVVLPLLPAHGVREPWPAMKSLEHDDWIRHIDRIVAIASEMGQQLSMGGFSTGGALTVHKVGRDSDVVTGGLYLFSAALDIGDHKETILESFAGEAIGRITDTAKFFSLRIREKLGILHQAEVEEEHDSTYGIGADPCKYSVFFNEGASELAEVIDDIDDYYDGKGIPVYSNIQQPCFVAHSRADESALFAGAERFINNHPNDRKVDYFLDHVSHSSLVLEHPVRDRDNGVIVDANRDFAGMMDAMEGFTRRYFMAT